MQQFFTKACTTVINIANNCLEADKSNKIVESRALVTKAADAITIMGKLNTMLTKARKTRLKPALSESYKSLCDQDFSQLVYLLGDYLPEEFWKNKSQHFLEATVLKSQKTGLALTKKRPSTSSEFFNYQGCKKNYSELDRINRTHSTDIKEELIPKQVSDLTYYLKNWAF